ncbi:DUF6292 family protein [Streptomyces solincola]|uniref:DUF6292 family protein n=1 Tax=Streptomyces solincola TaxID=2100817 RepID=UPI0021590EDD|nr:DUF6292 family protein [Streptomyces solincola]
MRTLADLAKQQGVALQTYRNSRRHLAEGFPAPVTSGRVPLYDAEQVDAYLAGRPVPAVPAVEDDQDLLDRDEAAALRGISPRSWDKYRSDPQLASVAVRVGGVEHWPRRAVREFAPSRRSGAAGGQCAAGGRRRGAGDQVPREELPALVAELLEEDAAISAAAVVQALGVHRDAAQYALLRVRAERMADVMEADPELTPQQAAQRLGYPAGQVRRAAVRAQTVLRGRRAADYLAAVLQALAAEGWTTQREMELHYPADDVVVASVVLDGPGAPDGVPGLVWDERAGWRAAASRRHPLGAAAAQQPTPGAAGSFLAGDLTPDAAELIRAVTA